MIAHLQALLPEGWSATLCAVDGATTATLPEQVPRVPAEATHVVVAIGGNDALANSDLLVAPVRSSTEALSLFASRLAAFERSYAVAIDRVLARCRAVTVCTIYNGALEPDRAYVARVGLRMFNDVIHGVALARALDVIELRSVCSEPADYANAIEPSAVGGAKIALAVAHAVGAIEPRVQPSRVWRG